MVVIDNNNTIYLLDRMMAERTRSILSLVRSVALFVFLESVSKPLAERVMSGFGLHLRSRSARSSGFSSIPKGTPAGPRRVSKRTLRHWERGDE